jgi:hypothetical protein
VLSTALLLHGNSGAFALRHAVLVTNFATAKLSGTALLVEPLAQMKCAKLVIAQLRTRCRTVLLIVMLACGRNGPRAPKAVAQEYTTVIALSLNPCMEGKVARERTTSRTVT